MIVMRKLLYLFMALSLLLFFMGCKQYGDEKMILQNTALSQEVFSPVAHEYELVWEEHFDGIQLDTTKFRLRGIGARRIGFNAKEAVSVSDGNLNLMYDIIGDSLISGAVGSQGLFETKYGYFECRARLQGSDGPWAAFWLQSSEISKGGSPAECGTEIDVFEYFRKYSKDTLTHALHWAYGPDMVSFGPMKSGLKGLDQGYHTFALEWTPEKYTFFIDSLKYHEQTQGLSHVKEYIILSMELPTKMQDMKKACAPDTFFVDYVKVYKKKIAK